MGFESLDYVVILLYLLAIVGISVFFMKGQKDTADYFLGGRRFHWFPIAISMYATVFSAISFISSPGRAYNKGMTMYLYSIFAVLGALLGVKIFVPFFRRLSLTTAYEYLEYRFNLGIRLLASFLFLMLRVFYLGVVLYATAVALEPFTGWSYSFSIVIVGVIATLYTALGGMKTVVWTDVVQFAILLGGILLVVFMLGRAHPDGFTGIWQYARSEGHTFNEVAEARFYRFDPFVTTFWGIFIFSVFTKLGYASADQSSIQRYLSTRNEKDASRSFFVGALLSIPVQFLLYFAGLGLLYFYATYPQKALPDMAGDHALARFISTELPAGVKGLLMAAILAAVMSTVDSVLNSLSACTVTDFVRRVFRPHATEQYYLRYARIATVAWGIVAIASAICIVALYGDLKKNPLMTVSNATVGFFIGILLAVFLLGILTKRANPTGVFAGTGAGLVAVLVVTSLFYFRDLPEGSPQLSFTWITIVGCFVTLVVGYGVSLLTPPPAIEKIERFTYWHLRG